MRRSTRVKRGARAEVSETAKKNKKEQAQPAAERLIPPRSVLLIKAASVNPEWASVELEGPQEIRYTELRRLVGGDLESPPIEHIYSQELPKPRASRVLRLYCNAEGFNMGLPQNLYGQEFGLEGPDGLCGDVVIVVHTDDGSSTCFEESDLELLPSALLPKDTLSKVRQRKRDRLGYADAAEGMATGAFLVNLVFECKRTANMLHRQVRHSEAAKAGNFQSMHFDDLDALGKLINAHPSAPLVEWCVDPSKPQHVLVRCVEAKK